MTTLLTLLLPALVAGYTIYIHLRSRTALASAGPAFTSFFQRTGYQYADMLGQPPEAQAARAIRDGKLGTSVSGFRYIRDFFGMRIEHHASWGTESAGHGRKVFRMSNQWDAVFPQPLRLGLHIADKRLTSSLLNLANEVLTRRVRTWSAQFPHQVTTGIPAIDSRFVVWSSDPAWAAHVFATQPSLVALLDGWAELDVVVGGHRGTFADPEMKNMNAALGGTIGNMAVGFDYAKRFELSIPVHDRIAELLATLGRACA